MKYRFDPSKNLANLRKHGVSLAEGDGVSSDPFAVTVEDDEILGEQRWVSIGSNFESVLRVVVWAPRDDHIRIISVRRAEPSERRAYEEGL